MIREARTAISYVRVNAVRISHRSEDACFRAVGNYLRASLDAPRVVHFGQLDREPDRVDALLVSYDHAEPAEGQPVNFGCVGVVGEFSVFIEYRNRFRLDTRMPVPHFWLFKDTTGERVWVTARVF